MLTSYRSVVWPLRRAANGDLVTGPLSKTLPGQVRACFQTRKFLGPNLPMERRMRPGFVSQMPTSLLTPFDATVIEPLLEAFTMECLTPLTESGKMQVERITTRVIQGGYLIRVDYYIPSEKLRTFYDHEVRTESGDTTGPSERVAT